MDWTWYLFRFHGRINRAKLWFGLLVMLCWMILLLVLVGCVGTLFGATGSFSLKIDDVFKIVDPATYRSLSSTKLPILFIKAAGTSLFLWVYLAISIKRLHDRDKSGWWMAPFFILPGLYNQFEDRLPDSYWILPFALASSALYLWGFIELCCLRGSPRTNRFGHDPLPKIQTTPRCAGGTSGTTRGWDQQSELEFVPHKAGPPQL
jgi:uncharacterized membrane protein YhaH (DUF805 family)